MGNRFKVGGKTYNVPEELSDKFLTDMEAKGQKPEAIDLPDDEPLAITTATVGGEVPYDKSAPVPPESEVPALAVEKTTVATPDAPAVTEIKVKTEPDVEEPGLLTKALDAISGGATAAGMGAVHGALAGAGRLLPGKLGENIRAVDDYYRQDSPVLYGAGDVGGSIASPINKLAPGVAGTGLAALAKRAVAQGLVGGAEGGVRNFADSEGSGQDYNTRAANAFSDAGTSALLSTGLSGALGLKGAIAGGIGDAAGAVRDRARLAAAHVPAASLESFAEKRGIKGGGAAAKQMVKEVEEISPPNVLKPRSPDDIAAQYQQPLASLNSKIEGALVDAEANGAQLVPGATTPASPVARADIPAWNMNEAEAAAYAEKQAIDALARQAPANRAVADQLRQQADAAGASAASANRAPALRQAANNVQGSRPLMSPQDVRAERIALDQEVYGGTRGSAESLAGQANAAAANGYRNMLYNFAEQGGPEVASQYGAANRAYEAAAPFASSAAAAGMRASSGQGSAIPGGFGGGVLNALSRIPGADYVPDAVGNAAALTSKTFGGMGAAFNGAANNTGAAVAALSSARQKQLAPSGDGSTETAAAKQADESRGYTDGARLNKLINTAGKDELRVLGPWAAELGGAESDDAMDALMTRLQRTDPNFNRVVKQLLAEGNSR